MAAASQFTEITVDHSIRAHVLNLLPKVKGTGAGDRIT